MSPIVTVQVRISGRVQGVGFRLFVQRQALAHGVTGWVRNRPDGSVEALFEGSREALDALLGQVHRGPPGARVTDVAVNPAAGGHEDFEVRPTA